MTVKMIAETRTASGKGAARQLRRENKVPAVIYGAGKDPVKVAVTGHSLLMSMKVGGFFSHAQEIEVDGKVEKVLPRDVQREPVMDKIEHVDFLRFDPNRTLKMMIPVRVTGAEQSQGVKIGGVVSLVRNEIEMLCRADAIPEFLEISVADMNVGESGHFSAIELPEGVEPTISDRDFTVVTILTSRTSRMADGEEGTDAEATEEGSEEASAE